MLQKFYSARQIDSKNIPTTPQNIHPYKLEYVGMLWNKFMDFEKQEGPKEESKEGVVPEEIPTKASDMEAAEFLAEHIDNPCEAEVAPGQIENIRDFYIREAERLLPKFTDPEARRLLELKIQEYKDK